MSHIENTPTFKVTFKKYKHAFIGSILRSMKTFPKTMEIVTFVLSLNLFWKKNAVNSVREALKVGKAQFEKFVVERMQCSITSIYATIK